MDKSCNTYIQIQNKIHTLRQREKIFTLISGTLLLSALLVGFSLLLVIIEATFRFSVTVRTGLVISLLMFCILGIGFWFVRPLWSILFRHNIPDDDDLALQVGKHLPGVKDRLVDGLQVARAAEHKNYGTSASLAFESLERIGKETEQIDFRKFASRKRLVLSAWVLSAVFFIIFCCSTIFPVTIKKAWIRMTHPASLFPDHAPFSMQIFPGNIRVIQGEDVKISVKVDGRAPKEIIIFITEERYGVQEIVLQHPYNHNIRSIRESIEYYAKGDRVRTPSFRVEVVQRPMVRTLGLKLFPPAYARLGTIGLESNTGYVSALKGTRVKVSIRANKILSEAALVFNRGVRRSMTVNGRDAAVEFIVNEEDDYYVQLSDMLGLRSENPILFTIRLQPDLLPVARITYPGKNIDLDEYMVLPLTLEGEDDYGISLCRLRYQIIRSMDKDSSEKIPQYLLISSDIDKPSRVIKNFTWDLAELDIFPGDAVSYRFEVFDNDVVSGPKFAHSRTYTARFPSVYEIFQEVEEEQGNQIENMKEIYEESRDLKDELERIARNLKTGKELEWEERKSLEKMAEKQHELTVEIDEMRDSIDNILDRMEQYDIFSYEIMEKYQELQNLYQEIDSPELMEAIRKLQEAAKEIDQEALRKAIESFKISQEGFLKSIERTLSLLKFLQVEQKAEELVKKIENLIDRQDEVIKSLTDNRDSNLSDLAEEEAGILGDSESLRQDMESLYEKMEELVGMPLLQLEAAMDIFDQQELLAKVDQMRMMLESGDVGEAGKNGKAAKDAMTSVSEMLKAMQKSLKRNQKEKVSRALKRVSYRMVDLSQEQERLIDESRAGKQSGSEAAQTQMSLLSGLRQVADSLVQLGRETFFVTPEMGRAIGEAQVRMRQALKGMEQSGSSGVSAHQTEAMGALNRGVLAIQEAMGNLSGASSAMGMEQFMLQMEQMAQQQLGINSKTFDLFNKGQLTLEEQAALARLSAEQEAVKKAVEEMLKNYSQYSEVLGRLDRMIEDMEGVVRDLRQRNASSETIRRQERILSRLLDAQHSIRRRDFSRKRESITGRDVIRESPSISIDTTAEWEEQIRRDILRIAQEGFTRDYQELIRRYFEALIRGGNR